MSPVNWPHVYCTIAVRKLLDQAYTAEAIVVEQVPLRLSDSLPQPDIGVYRGELRDYTSHPTNPIFIVEISQTTLRYDLTTKLELYAEAGVAEYWVLDVEGRVLHQFTQPHGSGYINQKTFTDVEQVIAPGCGITLQVAAMLQ